MHALSLLISPPSSSQWWANYDLWAASGPSMYFIRPATASQTFTWSLAYCFCSARRKKESTLVKSGGGFLPRQRFDKHQMAFLIIDIRPDFCNSLQTAKHAVYIIGVQLKMKYAWQNYWRKTCTTQLLHLFWYLHPFNWSTETLCVSISGSENPHLKLEHIPEIVIFSFKKAP